ncbi:MAG: hypothetical protein JRJ39_00200 [Deltaproteobacteria bacterium]|nr:hypothetical protein [Deltaproteobacteria bacterium]MBW2334506.1 hypothetical protein [Deltaproteobacteria bacterium]
MNVKRNWRETGIYWILCVISLGAVWLMRVMITVAIRMAFEDEDNSLCGCPWKSGEHIHGSGGNTIAVKDHQPGCRHYGP